MAPIRCGLAPHMIKGKPKFFTEQRHINFVRHTRKEFRPEYEVCENCYNTVMKTYKFKNDKAKKIKRLNKTQTKNKAVSDPSISTHSDSTTSNSLSRQNDTYDNIVFRTPRCLNLRSIVSEGRTPLQQNQNNTLRNTPTSSNQDNDASSSSSVYGSVSDESLQRSQQLKQTTVQMDYSTESSLDVMPSTSAAAAAASKKKTKAAKQIPTVTGDTDLWDNQPGLAVLNGSRLPHIQPIPRRQAFAHVNDDVMNMYLKGLTGG